MLCLRTSVIMVFTTETCGMLRVFVYLAGPRSAVGRAPDLYVRGHGYDTRSGHILLFLFPLIQEGQLSVTGESMCAKYWLTALEVGELTVPT